MRLRSSVDKNVYQTLGQGSVKKDKIFGTKHYFIHLQSHMINESLQSIKTKKESSKFRGTQIRVLLILNRIKVMTIWPIFRHKVKTKP